MKLRLKIILISLLTSLILGSISITISFRIYNASNDKQAKVYTQQTVSGFVDSLKRDDQKNKDNNLRKYIEEYTDNIIKIYSEYDKLGYFKEYSQSSEDEYLSRVEKEVVEGDVNKFNEIYTMMDALVKAGSTESLYLAYFDMLNGRVIYLLDIDKSTANPIGFVDSINRFGLKKGETLPDGFKAVIENQLCWGGQPIYKYSDSSHRSCFIMADVPMTTFNQVEKEFLKYQTIALTLLSVSLAIFMYVMSDRFIAQNIKKVDYSTSKFTSSLINDTTPLLFYPDVKSKDEIGNLAKNSYNLQITLIDYIKKLKDKTLNEQRILADLELARKIQIENLPKGFYEENNFVINAFMEPAKEVGGDFYDYFKIDDDNLCVVIADVSGKGIPAALFMMNAKELIRGLLKSGKNLKDALFEANNQLLETNEEGLFITLFAGVINMNTLEMDYINAGHERPIIIKKDKIFELETKSNFVLAGLNNFNYQMERVNLDKDDTILFYTDGLCEAIDDNFNQFGKENIIKSLKEEASLEHLKTNLKDFSKENQFDDETALLLKLKNVLSINIKNPKIENIDGVIEESRKYLSFLDSKTISQICIILDELLSNSIKYGIKDVTDSFINFVLSCDDKKINIDLIDNGIKFNPFGAIKKGELDEIGGRGLLVVDKLSSNRKYEYVNKKNHIHVEKIYE